MIDNHSVKSILLGGWMTIMPILFSSISGLYIIQHIDMIESYTFLQWCIFFIGVTLSMALALTPTTLVAICTGYFLGFNGLLPLVIAYTTASILGYTLAQYLGRNTTQLLLHRYPRTEQIIDQLNKKSPYWFVALCRLSPILPFGIMNVVLSFIGTPLKPFISKTVKW